MRFSVVVVLAGAAMVSANGHDTETEYSTSYYTVTSCPPSVHSCPAKSTSDVYYTSTVYSTKVKTITACPEEKTDCPLKHTIVVTDVVPVSTTVCPVTATHAPSYQNTTSGKPFYPISSKPFSTGISSPQSTAPAACPMVSVKTISTSVTTVVPTVIYETVSIPCPTTTAKAVPSGAPCHGANCTVTAHPTAVTAGAGSIGGSVLFAVVAGFVALVMA